jgi:uncharacterized RDD family membrane protein YckC
VNDMSQPNPYQPPQPDPWSDLQRAARGVGCIVILLLTPVATFIAFFAGCLVSNMAFPVLKAIPEFLAIAIVYALYFGAPAATLIGMCWWGIRAYRRQRSKADTGPNQRHLPGE